MNILGNIIKAQLPGLIEEFKKQLPTLIAQYKDQVPSLLEQLREYAMVELKKVDFDDNHIADFDEYQDDIEEIGGHLHASFEVVKRIEARALAMKAKLVPGVDDAKNTP